MRGVVGRSALAGTVIPALSPLYSGETAENGGFTLLRHRNKSPGWGGA